MDSPVDAADILSRSLMPYAFPAPIRISPNSHSLLSPVHLATSPQPPQALRDLYRILIRSLLRLAHPHGLQLPEEPGFFQDPGEGQDVFSSADLGS